MVIRIALEETNFWGPGPLQGELECKAVDTIVLVDSDSTEHRMSTLLLGGFDMGIMRMNSYYVEHHIRSRFPKTRSEGNVSLKILPTTHERREIELEKTRVCQLSVLASELEPLKKDFPRTLIVEELDHYRDYCFPEILPYKKTDSRPTLVAALCEHRQRYFERYPDIYEDTKAGLDELDRSEAATTRASRREQIKSTIYSLDEDVVEAFRNELVNPNL